MFSREIVCTDSFLDMPASTQALYFQFGMAADDDGFVSSPRKIALLSNCGADDIKLLASKGYIIPFASGICVITNWRQNNELKADRYHETIHLAEKRLLEIVGCYAKGNGGFYQMAGEVETKCLQNVSTVETQYSIDKDSAESRPGKPSRAHFTPPSIEEVRAYCEERHNGVDAQRFHDFYSANGWVQGRGKPVKDWKACVRTWETKGNAHNATPQQANTADAIKERREREQAATYTSDDIVEWPPGSGYYCLKSGV